jgi:hypothetical protein
MSYSPNKAQMPVSDKENTTNVVIIRQRAGSITSINNRKFPICGI